jgi:hypothetical protein
MFRKLKHFFHGLEYTKGQEKINYGDLIKYYETELTQGGVFNILPLQYRPDFQLSLMEIEGAVPPHTDSEVKTSINFYIEPGDYITTFYSARPGSKTSQIAGQTTGCIYEMPDLLNRGSFNAMPGDGWVLNVAAIHGVEPKKEVTRRAVLCLATDKHDFDAVIKMLYETGNV